MAIDKKFIKLISSVAWSAITGKPDFATVATTGSYNDLLNKPTIPTSFDVSSKLIGSNGYLVFKNGLIIEWGNVKTFTEFSFPKAFTTIYGIIGTKSIAANNSNKYYPVGTSQPSARTQENGICVTYTTTKAYFYSKDCNDNGLNTEINVFWIAIGK